MADTPKLNVPDDLGAIIDMQLKSANPDVEVGWLLITVTHGEPIQTMTNVAEQTQLVMCAIAIDAIEKEALNVSTLLNPEGSA